MIVVDVAGKVLHPGVYRLKQGSRAIDAIRAAGKQLRGVSLTDINLAEVLSDGQQIVVGAPPISTTSSKSKKSGGSSAAQGKITKGTININTATVAQYEQLPGIGAVMAARIFAYRTAHGPFATIDDLTKVSGMGKSKFANLKSFVRI
jgi:competence protein ComEA